MTDLNFDRRQFMKLAGIGGAVFASGLGDGYAKRAFAADSDFFFVQMSDSHWGFQGPKLNPEASTTLKTAVQRVNALTVKPDFIVFTGDLTHTTDDGKERRRRLAEFKSIVADLAVKDVRFMPGEHDASLDNGEAYKEFFGAPYWSFDHKGVHFVALDNVSDPGASIGEAQLAWLKADLAKFPADHPIVVFAHRPLFDLYPQWDWATRDGAKAVDIMMPYQNITVFYGHIHQEHHHMTGHIAHHAAMSLIFPQPVAGSLPKRDPVAWDPAVPYKGLGFRTVEQPKGKAPAMVTEQSLAKA